MSEEQREAPKCPLCGVRLVWGPMRVYETLCEHVASPNEEPPLRYTVECHNEECIACKRGFWSALPDGEWYHFRHWRTRNIPDLDDSAYGRPMPTEPPEAELAHQFWYAAWKQKRLECDELKAKVKLLHEACDALESNSKEASEVFEVLYAANLIPSTKPGPRLADIVKDLVETAKWARPQA